MNDRFVRGSGYLLCWKCASVADSFGGTEESEDMLKVKSRVASLRGYNIKDETCYICESPQLRARVRRI